MLIQLGESVGVIDVPARQQPNQRRNVCGWQIQAGKLPLECFLFPIHNDTLAVPVLSTCGYSKPGKVVLLSLGCPGAVELNKGRECLSPTIL